MLAFLKTRYHTTLAIAHVNYQLRGKESAGDEIFIQELAKKYQIPCFIAHYPQTSDKHDEKSLRDFRYRFFSLISEQQSFDTIALGHQKNDQAETFLMNLIRGSGPLGLASMPPEHGKYIRPLLDTSREDILQYLSACKLPFRQDRSNADVRYTRNRIRKELLPLLERRFNPNILATLAHSAMLFGDMDQLRETQTDSCPVIYQENTAAFSRSDFQTLALPAQKTFLRSLARILSNEQCTPTLPMLSELRKIIVATKTQSASLTIGLLKCTRNHDRVFLLYLPS